jgi:hypothetical protein
MPCQRGRAFRPDEGGENSGERLDAHFHRRLVDLGWTLVNRDRSSKTNSQENGNFLAHVLRPCHHRPRRLNPMPPPLGVDHCEAVLWPNFTAAAGHRKMPPAYIPDRYAKSPRARQNFPTNIVVPSLCLSPRGDGICGSDFVRVADGKRVAQPHRAGHTAPQGRVYLRPTSCQRFGKPISQKPDNPREIPSRAGDSGVLRRCRTRRRDLRVPHRKAGWLLANGQPSP